MVDSGMNLVEFADDNLAIDPDKITSIKQSDYPYRTEKCDEECPHRQKEERRYGTIYHCGKHDVWRYHTVITIDGKEFTVKRSFADVMLVLTAHQLDNADKSE